MTTDSIGTGLPCPEADLGKHAPEHTLLARYGFSDPDRDQPLHDAICLRLQETDATYALLRLVGSAKGWRTARRCHRVVEPRDPAHLADLADDTTLERVEHRHRRHDGHYLTVTRFACRNTVAVSSFSKPKVTMAHPLVHGTGSDAVLVGFIDMLLSSIALTADCPDHGKQRLWTRTNSDRLEQPEGFVATDDRVRVAVEVKVTPVPVLDVLRQIQVYRAFFAANAWAVVTGFTYSDRDTAVLTREGIVVVDQGPKAVLL